MSGFVQGMSVSASVFTLVAIAVERLEFDSIVFFSNYNSICLKKWNINHLVKSQLVLHK